MAHVFMSPKQQGWKQLIKGHHPGGQQMLPDHTPNPARDQGPPLPQIQEAMWSLLSAFSANCTILERREEESPGVFGEIPLLSAYFFILLQFLSKLDFFSPKSIV